MTGFFIFNLTPKRRKRFKKFFSVFTAISLILQIGNGLFLYPPAFAQEASPTSEQTEAITETPALPQEPTLESTASFSESTENFLPENTPTLEPTEISQKPAPAEETTPTPTIEVTPTIPTTELTTEPNLDINQTETPANSENGDDSLDLDPSAVDGQSAQLKPEITTDKDDYAPEETVTITGQNFPTNTTLLIKVTRPDGSVVKGDGSFAPGSDEVTTDSEGKFIYFYKLDGIIGKYLIEVFQGEKVLATTSFTDTPDNKVRICHATGSHSNPYIENQPNKSGDVSGHNNHNGPIWHSGITEEWGDIIPPFEYNDGFYPGKNWTTEGQVIWDNGCNIPSPSPTPSPTPTPTATPTSTPTPTLPSCEEGAAWASGVISVNQGTKKNGSLVLPDRSDPTNALGSPDSFQPIVKFFSLGKNGWIVLTFAGWILDVDGSDLSFHETTWGRENYPLEKAKVEVSQNGSDWFGNWEISNRDGGNGIGYVDFSSTGLAWIKYVRITDITDYSLHNSEADGYDLDAVDAVSQICEEPQTSVTPTPTATPTPASYCGDGEINQSSEECDENEGVTPEENFCTANCKLVPIYDGEHSCPEGTTKSQNPIITKIISATDSDGETFSLTSGGKYLFEVSGDYSYGQGRLADASYAVSGTSWSSSVRNDIGIWGIKRGVTSLLADLGKGVGIVEWDNDNNFNSDHIYTKYYSPTKDSVQFLISDWYDDWYLSSYNNQAGMSDNSGNLTLNVYECQEYGSISGYKWEDLDGDGEWDEDEPVVNGEMTSVTIFIDSDGDGEQEEGEPRTDVASDGSYSFVNLLAGTYNVCERADLLSGWKPTTPVCQSAEVFPGQTTEVNFGNYKLGYIQGRKYNDLDQDGTRDGNEPWLSGWTINLYDENWNYLSSTTTSGSNGIYRFENLDKGTYYTCEVLQSGWTQTGPTLRGNRVSNQSPNQDIEGSVCWRSVFNKSNQSRRGRQFGNSQLGSVLGYKYEDVNGNGQKDEDENNLLSGWTIQLKSPEDELLEEVSTGEDGYFELNNFVAGNYKLCEVVQSGWVVTDPQNNNCKDITIEAGKTTEVNFGNFELGRIEACKYDDLDEDGAKDDDEPGIVGISLKLQKLSENEELLGWTDVGDWEETGVDGCYVWEGLGPGTYRVLEDLNDPDLTGFVPTDDFLTEDTYRVADGLIMTSGGAFTVNFLNRLLPVTLGINKANDTAGSIGPGTAVNYTLTVTNNSLHTAYGVTVTDVLPYRFSYVSGSGKIGGISVDPSISGQVLTWALGDLAGGEVVEIAYQVSTDGGLETGSFTNIAYAYGYNRSSGGGRIRSESNIANSVVKIGAGMTYSATVSPVFGTVLGTATEAGQVLGAATGSPTYLLVLALLMIITGVVVSNWEKIKRFKFGKIKVLVLLAGILLMSPGVTQAAVQVSISDLPERINKYDFKIYYTVLDTRETPSYSVSGWMRKEGASWKQFDVTKTEPSGYFQAKGEYFEGEGKYYFKVIGNGVESGVEEVVIDFTSPGEPREYKKERVSTVSYRLSWRNPVDSDFEKVLVYRSEVRDFTADSSTLVGQRGGSPDQEMDFVDCCLASDKEYFYAIRAIDKAGNASGLVGDGGSTVLVEITPTPSETELTAETVKLLPKEEAKGEILGKETKEEESVKEEATKETSEKGSVLGVLKETASKNKFLIIGGIIVLVIGGLGYFFFYKKKTSK